MLSKIFRSYDIRGIYGEDINEEIFDKIGNAFTLVTPKDILIARDARMSSEKLLNAFMNGALRAERTVMNIGELPLGCAYHWATTQNFELAYITASHLPPQWNGLKFFHATGEAYMQHENERIKKIVESSRYIVGVRGVPVREEIDDVINLYVRHLTGKIKLSDEEKKKSKMKILIDCGNGTASIVAGKLFREAGFSADLIFEKPDGSFPNRLSDPNEDPLNELRKRVSKYDFGIAFDGDCDRVVFMDRTGRKLLTEQASYVMLNELLKSGKGTILANVECSSLIDEIAKRSGTNVVRFRVGHTFMLNAVSRTEGAVFALERSGHYVIPFLSSFDDAIAAALYFAYALHKSGKQLEQILKEVPSTCLDISKFACSDEKKLAVVERLQEKFSSEYSNLDTLDGVRINLGSSWALARASNTEPVIRLTVEAGSEAAMNELKSKFSRIIEEEIKKA